mgnify:FL=1
MVNFGLNSASILGIFLAIAGASLYFMRSFRPELSRDQDIFFAAVGLLCGFILLFQGWRLDPILQFGQFLLTGVAVAFGVETIRLRSATTEQAKRSAPTVDRDRRTSRVYRAEIDDMEPYFEEEEEPPESRRRLRGTASERSSYRSDREPASRSTTKSRSSSSRTRRKSSSRRSAAPDYYEDDLNEQYEQRDRRDADFEEEDYVPPRERRREETPSRPPRKPRRPETESRRTPSRPPVKRTSSSSRRRPSPPKEDYVDYRPVESYDEDDDFDNSNQFD